MGASPTLLLVTSTARTSDVSSSIPVYLAPDTVLWPTMLKGIPLAFAHGLDAGAVDQKVERADAASIRQAHIRYLLAATWRAVIRCGTIQPN